MKWLLWIVGILVVTLLAFLGMERLAAERVEVVELHALSPEGEEMTTRLWIVDHEGVGYLRVGGDGSGWYSRIQDTQRNPTVEITRAGQRARYRAVSDPTKQSAVNDLMQDKYTWGDTFIAYVVGGRDGSIPIALIPAP